VTAGQVIAALVALALAGAVFWRRRKLSAEGTVLAIAVAAVLAIYASGVIPDLPNPENAIEDVATTLGDWTYLLVGGLAFLETGAFVGLVAPGEFTVILGGVIAGQGEIDIFLLIGIVWFSAILGDTTSFLIGRRLGRNFLLKHGPRVRISRERLQQVERYFQRHGGKTILIGRFIGLVRALAPFVAGASGMRYVRFLPYSTLGTGLWAATFSLIGFFFYRSFSRVADIAGRATVGFGIVVGVIVAIVYVYRRLRHEEDRRRLAQWIDRQPVLRPVAAAVRPVWRVTWPRVRFLIGRLTPGNLGIEFTTALAVLAAGFYVFVLYTIGVADDPGPTRADRELLEVSNDLRAQAAIDVLKVVTDLGSAPVVVGLVLVSSIVLAIRWRPVEFVALAGGLMTVYVAVHLAKAGIDRPRPPASLVDTSKSSFPSGHATYSTAYVTMALIAARVLPGIASRAALVLASLAVVAVVGLSRVYLHAHYWSDVVGGWGLGFGIFGAFGAIALLVAHIRQNVRGSTPRRRRPTAAADRG
jgi:membrane protein DedA with SNARE-associated domain/membrane-associated phospholipid phosphatase